MFELVIGLEVHIQLNTKTKLFCGCSTSFGNEGNKNTCKVCLGMPGALPKLNKEAVIKAIQFGTAIKATINNNSVFERKNYFYPDSPTGYQISQLEVPIVQSGSLLINNDKRIRINRAHLETDAGKSIHYDDHTEIDFNRVGTPLLEIVSEPDFRSANEVTDYLKRLQTLVRHLDISNANLAEGSFRCDVNISIRPKGDSNLYTRVEIKNMNSFKFIEKAIKYESERQMDAWEDGTYDNEVYQETRLFDTNTYETKSMRGKEEVADYRYFPDPDLLPVTITDEIFLKGADIPELPSEKYIRYTELGIKKSDSEILINNIELDKMFNSLINDLDPKDVVVWLFEYQGKKSSDNYITRTRDITINDLNSIISLLSNNTISNKAAKKVMDFIITDNSISKTVDDIVDELDLKQVSNENDLIVIIDDILSENENLVIDYKNGKTKLLGSFVGKVMKASKGKANPQLVNKLLQEKLS